MVPCAKCFTYIFLFHAVTSFVVPVTLMDENSDKLGCREALGILNDWSGLNELYSVART